MKGQVTIKDIAKQLNISVATVSRALRNASDVNENTKEKVLKLAASLNYQPNFFAQSLVKKQTKIIGVIVPSIHSNYFSEALSAMTDTATEFDYYLMICQSNETYDQEIRNIRKLVACNVDGLLISVSKETRKTDEFLKVSEFGIPIVMFDRILPTFECSKIIVDEYEGAQKAVEHLIRKGCKRIAHIAGPRELSVSINRMNGYLDALKEANMEIDEDIIIHCKSFEEDALQAIKKLMKQPNRPDGIFCINDRSAVIILKYLNRHGVRVPEDIKVAGFNNDPISEVVEPSLTTVMQPGYEVGKLAIGILLDEINHKTSGYKTLTLRTKLLPRNSSK